MPIDPTIALGVRPIQIQSPLEAAGKAMTLRSMAQHSRMNEYQLQAMQNKAEDETALARALAESTTIGEDGVPSIDFKRASGFIAKSGRPGAVQALGQIAKLQREEQNSILDHASKLLTLDKDTTEAYSRLAAGITDEPSRQAMIGKAASNPLLQGFLTVAPEFTRPYDPGTAAAAKYRFQSLAKQDDIRRKIVDDDRAERALQETKENNQRVDLRAQYTAQESMWGEKAKLINQINNEFRQDPTFIQQGGVASFAQQIKSMRQNYDKNFELKSKGGTVFDNTLLKMSSKINDVRSAVVNSELYTPIEARAILTKLDAWAAKQQGEGSLTAQDRREIFQLSDQLMAGATKALTARSAHYKDQGQSVGLPRDVIANIGGLTGDTAGSPPTAGLPEFPTARTQIPMRTGGSTAQPSPAAAPTGAAGAPVGAPATPTAPPAASAPPELLQAPQLASFKPGAIAKAHELAPNATADQIAEILARWPQDRVRK
jgi:hypothetical protein